MPQKPLPIDSAIPSILQVLENRRNLVLSASPGAGKTTRLPPALLQMASLQGKKILVLEPRRLAAVAAATRIAEEQSWKLGDQVGYQIRFDSHFQKHTRLIFLTEALLNRKLLDDPELSDVGLIVLDEFHERSQHVDLALGLLKELQQLARPDLQIIVMSATLTAEPIAQFLGDAEIIKVPGQSHALQIVYQKTAQKLRTTEDFIRDVASQVRLALSGAKSGEHLLVFLPGFWEIERVAKQLENWCSEHSLLLLKLHGSLSLEEQQKVLSPTDKTKVILSTNLAESSLTIDGVRIVIDSGLQRRSSLNAKTGFPQLDLARISKSSATQRAGRAARQGPGKCIKLWSSLDELSMPQEETAEILRTDLSEALLFLSSQSVRDFSQFSWFEQPSREALGNAEKHLKILGAFSEDNSLTHLGKTILKFPLPPRLGKLLLLADQAGIRQTGAELVSLLLEKDLLQRKTRETLLECDLLLRLDVYHEGRYPLVDKLAQQLVRLFPSSPQKTMNKSYDADLIRKILLQTFSDQVCRRRKPSDPKAVMIGGRGVSLDPHSQVRESEFFVALQLIDGLSSADTQVRLACGFDRSWLNQIIGARTENKSWVEFDNDSHSQRFVQKEAMSLILPSVGSLPLSEIRSKPARPEDIQEKLGEIAYQKRSQVIGQNEKLKSWWTRFEIWQSRREVIYLSDEILKEIFAEISFGENSLVALNDKDLVPFFESKLDASSVQNFHSECPEFMLVPSGSRIRVDYTGANPSLQVRLQEVFSWSETPKIASGQVPLTLVLLAPNYRPVQVTQDLKSFWKNAYPEVRKELRARYPKHSWPEDPSTAPPQAKGRPRQV